MVGPKGAHMYKQGIYILRHKFSTIALSFRVPGHINLCTATLKIRTRLLSSPAMNTLFYYNKVHPYEHTKVKFVCYHHRTISKHKT
jgi:hypothetical protein